MILRTDFLPYALTQKTDCYTRKPDCVVCKKQRRRPACALAQSDQRFCYSLSMSSDSSTCYMQNFNTLTSLCSLAGWIKPYMVTNPQVHMTLPKTRITKALISLRGCAGWSAPLLFPNPKDKFSHNDAHTVYMGLDATKPVFGVSNNARLKPVSSATETS